MNRNAGNVGNSLLVVEDDLLLQQSLKLFLEAKGYEITIVEQYTTAVTLLEQRSFQMLLLDVYLPDGNGLELLRIARRLSLDTKIILFSGKDSLNHRLTAFAQGADDYLPKPFSLFELSYRIERLFRYEAKHELSDVSLTEDYQGQNKFVALYGKVQKLLSGRERCILAMLVKYQGAVVPYDLLLQISSFSISQENLQVIIHRINRKLTQVSATMSIAVRYGWGYFLKITECKA